MRKSYRITSKSRGCAWKFSGKVYPTFVDEDGDNYVVDDEGVKHWVSPEEGLLFSKLWYDFEEVKQEVSLSVTPGTVAEAPKVDMVNSPKHYGQGKIECIDYIEDFLTKEEYIGYLRGNIAKYLHRWRYKNGLEDLKKAQVYLGWLIKKMEE